MVLAALHSRPVARGPDDNQPELNEEELCDALWGKGRRASSSSAPDEPAAEDAPAGDEASHPDPTRLARPDTGERVRARRRHGWRSPGITDEQRAARREKELKELLRLEAHHRARERRLRLSPTEISSAVKEKLKRIKALPNRDEVLEQFDATALPCVAPPTRAIRSEVMVGAILRLPAVSGLLGYLRARTGSNGPVPARAVAAAVLVRLAFMKGDPEIKPAYESFDAGQTLQAWAHDYPEGGPTLEGGFYDAFDTMLDKRDPTEAVECNVALVKWIERLFPGFVKIALTDGSDVLAPVRQVRPKSPEHRRLILQALADRRMRIQFRVYTDENGEVIVKVLGYKLVLISIGTIPLIWKLAEANCDEREVVLELLEQLFQLWPDCPMKYLVGDAYFDHSKEFNRKLLFNWGLVGVFPKAEAYARDLPHVAHDGVPHCRHGEMTLDRRADFPIGAAWRRKRGLAPGEPAMVDPRLIWTCPLDVCRNLTTRPRHDARLYTYLPRGGTHKSAALRTALLLRRNAIESLFRCLHHFGVARKEGRPAWAVDCDMDWLVSMALLQLTGRALAWESGLYAEVKQRARERRLLDQPRSTDPTPGPTAAEVEEDRAYWRELLSGWDDEAGRSGN